MRLAETAYAKINLALHVRARRPDGYHEIETLFAFVNKGDRLTACSAPQDSVRTLGEFAAALDNPFDNLVARALARLPRPAGLAVTLEKNLPVAAGLGGGSADAGAMFRMVEQVRGLPPDWEARASALGADVPACVRSITHIGRGTGTDSEGVVDDMAGTPVLLVNPRLALSTPEVFAAWDGKDRGPLPAGTAHQIAEQGRNDLRDPAISLCPAIARILEALGRTDPWMAQMSGSGATCFALYSDEEQRDRAARFLAQLEPGWWLMAGKLR